MKDKVTFILDKEQINHDAVEKSLLEILENDFGYKVNRSELKMVLLDGKPVDPSKINSLELDGHCILTNEAVIGGQSFEEFYDHDQKLGDLQCSYCTQRMIISALELLFDNPKPSETEIETAFDGSLCCCNDYEKILHAVKSASEHR